MGIPPRPCGGGGGGPLAPYPGPPIGGSKASNLGSYPCGGRGSYRSLPRGGGYPGSYLDLS